MHSVRIELAKLILVGTRITYQATGDAGSYVNDLMISENNSCLHHIIRYLVSCQIHTRYITTVLVLYKSYITTAVKSNGLEIEGPPCFFFRMKPQTSNSKCSDGLNNRHERPSVAYSRSIKKYCCPILRILSTVRLWVLLGFTCWTLAELLRPQALGAICTILPVPGIC